MAGVYPAPTLGLGQVAGVGAGGSTAPVIRPMASKSSCTKVTGSGEVAQLGHVLLAGTGQEGHELPESLTFGGREGRRRRRGRHRTLPGPWPGRGCRA